MCSFVLRNKVKLKLTLQRVNEQRCLVCVELSGYLQWVTLISCLHGPLSYTTQRSALWATRIGPPSSATLHGPPANLRKVGNCCSAEKHICSATCILRLKCVCTSVWSLQCYSITVLTNTQVCVKA